jgi:hypothetical protein
VGTSQTLDVEAAEAVGHVAVERRRRLADGRVGIRFGRERLQQQRELVSGGRRQPIAIEQRSERFS